MIACLISFVSFEDSGRFIARQSAEVLQSSLFSIQSLQVVGWLSFRYYIILGLRGVPFTEGLHD